MAKRTKQPKQVASLSHAEAKRTNIPTAEYESVMEKSAKDPVKVAYPRAGNALEDEKAARNRDLDPQLVWRGKDTQDWSDLVVNAPPLYIQEKVKPKILIDDLLAATRHHPSPAGRGVGGEGPVPADQPDLFGDFNGLPKDADKTDFYQYEGNWQNRMILGDSMQVMASLAEREGLRGKVQCIYLDPPYGIKFNSNFQWSTTSCDVKDGNAEHITREPEQVKAFRDTWRDGIHSYLTYLRDRLTVARDLLTESGSIFVQIGDENVHRVRAVMDEVFGDENFVSQVLFSTTSGFTTSLLSREGDLILWYAKNQQATKFRQIYRLREAQIEDPNFRFVECDDGAVRNLSDAERSDTSLLGTEEAIFRYGDTSSQGSSKDDKPVTSRGLTFQPPKGRHWTNGTDGTARLIRGGRTYGSGNTLSAKRYAKDYRIAKITNVWSDTVKSGFAEAKVFVVQTATNVVERCVLLSTDPGDLVLDPTCGSGTTAYVAEQWGRRWITIDTSRVALALARARIMGARYPYYLLADSQDGQLKEAEVTRSVPRTTPTYGHIHHGFVYERVPHITLKAIANNAEIDVIWDEYETKLKPLREALTTALPDGWLAAYRAKRKYTAEVPDAIAEWEVPRAAFTPWASDEQKIFFDLRAAQESGKHDRADTLLAVLNHNLGCDYTLDTLPEQPGTPWNEAAQALVAQFWELRIARQKDIDASIAAKADFEYLYDKPYEDRKKVRVAGPFTVESLSPHRMLGVDEHGEVIDSVKESAGDAHDFADMILENLKAAGVQQAHKDGKIDFTTLTAWPGYRVCAEGRYMEGEKQKRAGIFIGPEFGTVTRPDLVEAAREAADADFDVLIACAFSYDAHSSEFEKLGRIPVLKARMNADLHMADDLKNTGKGNLFVIFGEPDVDVLDVEDGDIQVRVNGVDVFKPQTGEVVSDGPGGIACWFVDTNYNAESFFVRQAYFLGANDPYKSLKTTLKAEINADAWATLHSDTSRPFPKPETGRIAVKIINHLGDEVMKVFKVV